MTTSHTQRAIELAKSAGYETKVKSFDENMNDYRRYFLDPLFWQSLGKALGWTEVHYEHCPSVDYGEFGEPRKCDCSASYEWKVQWHSFIDTLASGKTPDDFFATILPADK